MSGIVIGIIIAIAFIGFVVFLLWRKKTKKVDNLWKLDPTSRGMAIVRTGTPVLTPNGHKVYFEKGADPSVFSLPACDAGVEKTFQKGECANYPVDRTKHHVSIAVFNSIPDSQGDPAFKVFIGPGNYYYGGEYDKEAGKGQEVDHYILAAAQTIAIGDPFGDVIVVPHHSGKEAHLSTVCEYEMEHCILAYYDGTKFEETKNHGSGQGHPLIPDCPPPVGFTAGVWHAENERPSVGLCGGAVK